MELYMSSIGRSEAESRNFASVFLQEIPRASLAYTRPSLDGKFPGRSVKVVDPPPKPRLVEYCPGACWSRMPSPGVA